MDRLPKDFQAYVDAVSRRMKRNRRRVALERWLSGLKHCASRALYWVPRIALFIVVVVLALFLGSAKSANAQQQDGSLYVTFIPAKAKKAVDPLLLPIDIIRPAKPDENYKRIIADLSANGYAEAKFDLYPDEYRGKCLLVWRDEKYLSSELIKIFDLVID
ncbi:MAG: hypothetical protein ABI747_00625, partial [Candidatus Moraniibacteriota bacterium]